MMKKSLKIFVIVIFIVISIILVDTLVGVLLKNSPLISFRDYLSQDSYRDRGIIIDTYYCNKEKDNVSYHFKTSKFDCPLDEEENGDTMKIIINNSTYNVNLENNETVYQLLSMLPLEVTMKELNNNEKYYYLDTRLPSNKEKIGTINKGDIMLYGDDCIVIFYKSFTTNYQYTKIGHIDNLPDLDDRDIKVKFVKE